MSAPRCCHNRQNEVVQRKGALDAAARLATRRDHPRYIEAANQAKAKYIKARDELASHLETCAEATA